MTNSEIIDGLKAIRTIHNGNYALYVDEAIKRISAENTGHWIEFVINKQHKIKCDKCNYIEPKYITHIRNFCPNCGVRMSLTIRKGEIIRNGKMDKN